MSRSRAAPLEAPGSGRYRPAQRPRRERGRPRATQRISSPPSAAELAIRRGPVMRQLKLAFLTMLLTAGAGTVDQPRGQGQADHPRSSWLVVEGLLPPRTLRRTAIGLAAAEHRPDHSGQLVGNAPWPTSDRRRAGCGAGCRRDRHRSRAGMIAVIAGDVIGQTVARSGRRARCSFRPHPQITAQGYPRIGGYAWTMVAIGCDPRPGERASGGDCARGGLTRRTPPPARRQRSSGS